MATMTRLPRTLTLNGRCYRRADLVAVPSVKQVTLTFRFPDVAAAERFWPQLDALGESTTTTKGTLVTVVCAPELVTQVTDLAAKHGGVPADLLTGRASPAQPSTTSIPPGRAPVGPVTAALSHHESDALAKAPKAIKYQGQLYVLAASGYDLWPHDSGPRWDHFFETNFGHDYFAKALGYKVTPYGEVDHKDPKYKAWQKDLKQLHDWTMQQLKALHIDAYGKGNEIDAKTLTSLAQRAKSVPKVGDVWAKAFTKFAKDAK